MQIKQISDVVIPPARSTSATRLYCRSSRSSLSQDPPIINRSQIKANQLELISPLPAAQHPAPYPPVLHNNPRQNCPLAVMNQGHTVLGRVDSNPPSTNNPPNALKGIYKGDLQRPTTPSCTHYPNPHSIPLSRTQHRFSVKSCVSDIYPYSSDHALPRLPLQLRLHLAWSSIRESISQ